MLKKAKDRFVNFSNFNYKVEDFSELNFETETFDLIISGLAIHHLDDSLKKNYFKKLKNFKKRWLVY
jgi:tRNA (cmo5U34)-methyltransferase